MKTRIRLFAFGKETEKSEQRNKRYKQEPNVNVRTEKFNCQHEEVNEWAQLQQGGQRKEFDNRKYTIWTTGRNETEEKYSTEPQGCVHTNKRPIFFVPRVLEREYKEGRTDKALQKIIIMCKISQIWPKTYKFKKLSKYHTYKLKEIHLKTHYSRISENERQRL